MQNLLQIKNIRIDKLAKDDQNFNLDLNRGEVHAVMGESGAGKTCLANILAGIQTTESGDIYLNQQLLQIKKPAQSIASGIGVLFGNNEFSHFAHLTVKEYLYLWTSKWLVYDGKIEEKARRLLDEYEISIHPASVLKSLNLEERCLIEVMRLLAQNPLVLILDEPSANLSELKKQHLFRIIRKYVAGQNGVLYLSNQLEEVLQIGNRVTILRNGNTPACFPIDYAKRNPEKILSVYFGRESSVDCLPQHDEFKEVIDTLLHTTELLTSEYELQDLLSLLVEKISAAFKADACSIILFNESSANVMECFRHSRSNLPLVELKEDVIKGVIGKGQPLIINHIWETESSLIFNQKTAILSLLCMPISVRSKINGIIAVFFIQSKNFDQEEVELLKTFATQVAIAIENTRLLGRSTLLKEAHHRIKNNLQFIISLMNLQIRSKSKKDLEVILREIIDRINTIAAIHEILSQDERSIGLINFRNLVNLIANNYHEKEGFHKVQIRLEIPDWYVPYKTASSLGLIVNELVSNCFEHAFPGTKKGNVLISLEIDESDMILHVFDDGIGLKKDLEFTPANTLGLSLVKTLVSRDLRGILSIKNKTGTQIRITFPRQQIHY